MTRLSAILDQYGRPIKVDRPREAARAAGRAVPRASFDAAGSGDANRRHWGRADGLSANAANNPDVRQKLRNRSRYEFDNNSYFHGLILTLANDLIGTGPTLQVLTEDDDANAQVEARFGEWAEATGFTEKLHTAKQAKTRDGEAFGRFYSNPRSTDPVQLDLDVFEADLCTTWTLNILGLPSDFEQGPIDGIKLDKFHNPVAYYVLKNHPGDSFAVSTEFDTVPASEIVHWFRKDRPRQYRGVPEVTAALPLGAQLRRYTLATLSASEIAADFAALLKSQAPAPGDDEPDENTDAPFTALEIERGMMTTLPAGTVMQQLKAEQPVTQYPAFKQELLKEIGRPCNAPFNVVSGDSSQYNYSSARLDHLLYRVAQRVERDSCRRVVLERVFAAWYAEARLIPGHLPAGLPDRLPHAWYWPGSETIDPLKEALADGERLTTGTTTLAELLAESGQDWKVFLRQRAREMEEMKRLGLPLPAWMLGGTAPAQKPQAEEPGTRPGEDQGPANAQARRLSYSDLLALAGGNGHNGGQH